MRRTVEGVGVTPPKPIVPGKVCLVTAGCVSRQFRLAPNRKTLKILWKCFAAACDKFAGRIEMHAFQMMSNHYHLLLTDVKGVLPEFMEWLDSLIARSLNALRGVSGKNFEGYSFQVIDPDDTDRILRAAVYILCNPCKAHLVSRCKHWKGVSSYGMKFGASKTVKTPALGMWTGKVAHLRSDKSARSGRAKYARTKIPEESTIVLHRPPGFDHLTDAQLDKMLKNALTVEEEELIAIRKRKTIEVTGWDEVTCQHWAQMPGSSRELFDRNPDVAASTEERRERLEREVREFRAAYYAALRRFKAGEHDVEFPYGTWLLVQRYGRRCAPPPDC